MPKTDNGFQGFRSLSYRHTWDNMTSPERRWSFILDLVVVMTSEVGTSSLPGGVAVEVEATFELG